MECDDNTDPLNDNNGLSDLDLEEVRDMYPELADMIEQSNQETGYE